MRKFISIGLLFFLAGGFLLADEEEENQARIFFFAETRLFSNVNWRAQSVFPNVAATYKLLFYTGPSFKFSKKFSLALMAGNLFKGKENDFKVAVATFFNTKGWSICTQFDYSISPKNVWCIIQARHFVWKKVWIGAESENTFFGPEEKQYRSVGPCIGINMSELLKVNLTYFFKQADGRNYSFLRLYLILNLGGEK